jgi:formate-dependent nitrite reductase cytochrome c552 subunit
MLTALRAGAVLLCAVVAMFSVSGCVGAKYETDAVVSARAECGECHTEVVEAFAAGPHTDTRCEGCHAEAPAHAADPESVRPAITWRVGGCAQCHDTIAAMFLYDDNLNAGPFGGSQREPAMDKVDKFPEYHTIVAGHAFVRDYREEGAHKWTLGEHYETLRPKFETCLPCKSTQVAWAWNTGSPLTVAADTQITLAHTAADDAPARTVDVPAGTVVTLATDHESYEVSASAVFPDGRTYTSRPAADEDPAEHRDMLWAATMASTKETMPTGTSCNHCHDPHSGSLRIIRSTLLDAIQRQGGVNPYDLRAVTDAAEASKMDFRTLLCAQCHVEYTCGRGVDGVVRDHYGWAKAGDLHELYTREFGYRQDWTHAIIGEPLIKSQHPEVELFWNSVHHDAGASCGSCHMPRVQTRSGEWVRSHWMTSPYKYHRPDIYGAFAESVGLQPTLQTGPCATCHSSRIERAIEGQAAIYERQKEVQSLLAESVGALGAVRAAIDAGVKIDAGKHGDSVEEHRQAHVLWENLVVSENSMGFHNFAEVFGALDDAEAHAREAIRLARESLPGQE